MKLVLFIVEIFFLTIVTASIESSNNNADLFFLESFDTTGGGHFISGVFNIL